jgi:hypothetical protein
MSARTDLCGGVLSDWYPYRDRHNIEMSSLELYPKIQPTGAKVTKLCHCGRKAKWIVSLRLEGAQIEPAFQHEDLCNRHARQFAAKYDLKVLSDDLRARKSRSAHS